MNIQSDTTKTLLPEPNPSHSAPAGTLTSGTFSRLVEGLDRASRSENPDSAAVLATKASAIPTTDILDVNIDESLAELSYAEDSSATQRHQIQSLGFHSTPHQVQLDTGMSGQSSEGVSQDPTRNRTHESVPTFAFVAMPTHPNTPLVATSEMETGQLITANHSAPINGVSSTSFPVTNGQFDVLQSTSGYSPTPGSVGSQSPYTPLKPLGHESQGTTHSADRSMHSVTKPLPSLLQGQSGAVMDTKHISQGLGIQEIQSIASSERVNSPVARIIESAALGTTNHMVPSSLGDAAKVAINFQDTSHTGSGSSIHTQHLSQEVGIDPLRVMKSSEQVAPPVIRIVNPVELGSVNNLVPLSLRYGAKVAANIQDTLQSGSVSTIADLNVEQISNGLRNLESSSQASPTLLAGKAASLDTHFDFMKLSQQLKVAIDRAAAKLPQSSGEGLRVNLSPESLGRLEVQVKGDGDRIAILFNVSNSSAREAILSQLDRFREQLSGTLPTSVNVLVDSGGEHPNQRGNTSNNHQGQRIFNEHSDNPVPEANHLVSQWTLAKV